MCSVILMGTGGVVYEEREPYYERDEVYYYDIGEGHHHDRDEGHHHERGEHHHDRD